jgi:hypothetical protein
MREYLSHLQSHDSVLSTKLSSVLVAGFVEEEGCVLLAAEAHNPVASRAATQDETGYECIFNHLHIKDLGEALEFAQRLNGALAERFRVRFVVIVSFDGREATVRFHKLRSGQTWLNDDLEGYLEEGIAILDSE